MKSEKRAATTKLQTKTESAIPIFVYSAEYNMDLGVHVFPAVKYGYVYLRLVDDARFRESKFIEPEIASAKQLELVHSHAYVADLLALRSTDRLMRSELPLTRGVVDSFLLSSGGTILAARKALECGSAINLGGGFHHAFADHAEGFCYLNDVAISIRVLMAAGLIHKALIIDLDVHQGNGTARIFRNDPRVFTFSMHEEHNYPQKEKSDLDIGLASGCRDEEYLTLQSQALAGISRDFEPDIIFYLAGADVYEHDLLGGLSLTVNGIGERDRMIRDFMPGVPLVSVLAGGYAKKTEDTVDLHIRTCEILAGVL